MHTERASQTTDSDLSSTRIIVTNATEHSANNNVGDSNQAPSGKRLYLFAD